MSWYHRSKRLALALPVILALGTAVQAQEGGSEEIETVPQDSGLGGFYVELDAWVAQPSGLEYQPATQINPTNPLDIRVLNLDSRTDSRPYARVGYELPDDRGEFILTYYSHEDVSSLSRLNPGVFLYGAINTSGFLAGVNNDGLADGVIANTRTRLRDLRLDFYRSAFKAKRASGKWFVGYRRIAHDRSLDANYYALAANLPPILPPQVSSPRPDLVPKPEAASLSSDWSGRGLEAGLDVKLPLRTDKYWFQGGLTVAVLRGKVDTSYGSTTYFYATTADGRIDEILQPPYDELGEVAPPGEQPPVNSIVQVAAQTGLQDSSEERSATALETWLEFRWRFWKHSEFLVGFRNIQYSNVGEDIRTDQVLAENDLSLDEFMLDGTPIIRLAPQTIQRTDHSANYEGFYLGLAFRF